MNMVGKKVNIILIFFFLVFSILGGMFIIGGSTRVYAKDQEEKPLTVHLFELATKFVEKLTNDNNPNVFQSTTNTIISLTSFVFSTLAGSDSVDQETGMYTHDPGLAELSFGLAYQSFSNPITAEPIDKAYASLLLPNKIVQLYDTDTYAAGTQGEISGQSASHFLNQLGLFTIWKITFGISTLIFVLMLIVAGFMIMFKQKIGGQTLVTLSMAVKNSIYGFLGALASYGIGIFFFNLSKLLVVIVFNLSGTIMNSLASSGQWGTNMHPMIPVGPWEMFKALAGQSNMWTTIWNDLFYAVAEQARSNVDQYNNYIGGFGIITKVADFVIDIVSRISQISSVFVVIIFIIIGFAIFLFVIFVKSFQIFTAVLKIYLAMFIDIIMAPLIFIAAIIPGHESSMHSWFKRMLKNATLIPFMFFLLNLVIIIFQFPSGHDIVTSLSGGTLIGDTDHPNVWGVMMNLFVKWMAGIALMGMTLKADAILNEMFGVKESQGIKTAMAGAMDALKNTPVVGGMFN